MACAFYGHENAPCRGNHWNPQRPRPYNTSQGTPRSTNTHLISATTPLCPEMTPCTRARRRCGGTSAWASWTTPTMVRRSVPFNCFVPINWSFFVLTPRHRPFGQGTTDHDISLLTACNPRSIPACVPPWVLLIIYCRIQLLAVRVRPDGQRKVLQHDGVSVFSSPPFRRDPYSDVRVHCLVVARVRLSGTARTRASSPSPASASSTGSPPTPTRTSPSVWRLPCSRFIWKRYNKHLKCCRNNPFRSLILFAWPPSVSVFCLPITRLS